MEDNKSCWLVVALRRKTRYDMEWIDDEAKSFSMGARGGYHPSTSSAKRLFILFKTSSWGELVKSEAPILNASQFRIIVNQAFVYSYSTESGVHPVLIKQVAKFKLYLLF